MRNFRYFSTVDEDRLRFSDRVRFLFHGRAFKRRFAARAAQHGIVFSSKAPSRPFLAAAASFATLVAILSIVGWLGGQIHEARVRNQSLTAELHGLRQRSGQPRAGQPQTAPRAPEVRPVLYKPDDKAPLGRRDLEQARADLERARAGARDLAEQLQSAREQIDSLRSEIADSRTVEARLSDQLRGSELRLSGMTSELTRLQAGHTADMELIASQKFNLRDLSDRLNAQSDTIARERKMLVADLDIRELMGARSLHIVDVSDVDPKGKTRAPFGRVFYTEGKSLIFYAFDLKDGATFQAWGQREARAESAQSLGIFYVDDKKQNRWVLKFDNPKVLAEINSVFVTVEPPGGSLKPNRQKMMYAYLNATANHP